jgi:SAM-dependent methyltransferase
MSVRLDAGPSGGVRRATTWRAGSEVRSAEVPFSGCGAGRYLDQLGSPVVGVDAAAAMLALAGSRDKPLVRGDLEHLPFATASFSGVFARRSYLHIPKPRVGDALAEAARVLQPAGLLLIAMISGNYEGHSLRGDDIPGRWFSLGTEPELTAALTIAGFTLLRVDHVRRRQNGAEVEITGMKT